MGYSYGYNDATGRQGLACDSCGHVGGVRKVTCPHVVTCDSLRSVTPGARHGLPYCPAPALCAACRVKHPRAELHARCKEGAEASQREYDAKQAQLEAGAYLVVSACGSWHDRCPDGFALVTFRNLEGSELERLISKDEYDRPGAHGWTLEQFTGAALVPVPA
jgi:hypothetical protein